MKEAGIHHLRDEISWAWVERVRDKLEIPANREDWVKEAALQGIDILMILDYSNPVHPEQGVGNVNKPEYEFDVFGRYVEFMVNHFKDKVHRWEIWNEPNSFMLNTLYGGDWRGGGWVEAYARLADTSLRRIRAIDPSAEVYTAGMEAPIAELVIPYLKGDFDAVAIHPYCAPLLPEYAYPGIQNLRRTMKTTEHDVPVVVTEQGYPAVGGVSKFMWKHSATITEIDQARFALRAYCGNYLQGIPRTYWYDFICDGTDPDDPEHNFGLLNGGAESPRPAYTAVKTLTTFLNRRQERAASPVESVVGRRAAIAVEPMPSVPVRAMLFARDPAHYFLVLWKESESRDPLVIDGINGSARVFHDDGDPESVRLRIPAFSAGRLVATTVDPVLGPESETALTVDSDGLDNLLDVDIKESPVVVELLFE